MDFTTQIPLANTMVQRNKNACTEQRATVARLTKLLDEQAKLNALVIAFNREMRRLKRSLDKSRLILTALKMLQKELEAEGVGYFELQDESWICQQRVGQLPPACQPMFPEEDDLPKEVKIEGQHQIIVRVITNGLLFFVRRTDKSSTSSDSLLNTLTIIGDSLGHVLHHISLTNSLKKQIHHYQDEQTQKPLSLSIHARRQPALMIDANNEIKKVSTSEAISDAEQNTLVLPLTMRGEGFGKLLIEDEEEHEWSKEELALIDVVAEQMSQALEVAWLFEQSQRRAAQIEAAAEVGRAAVSTLELEDLMSTTVEQIRHAFDYYHAQVFLLDESKEWAVLRSSTGEAGKKLLESKHKLKVGGQSIVGQVTADGKPVVLRDTDKREVPWRFNKYLPKTRAELGIPMRVGETIIGALDVQSLSPDVFYGDDTAVLQTLADQLAIAIQNARAYKLQLETTEQLRALDKLKTQFLANMSHELRTPLNSIIGFSRVILKGIDGPITELQEKDLNTIYNSGQMLLQLIDSILDIAKIEAGKMELEFEKINLKQVIDVSISTAKGLVKDKPVKIQREVPADLPYVLGDAVRLRQVLLNLLSNAAKFTEEGRIRVTATEMGSEVMISVSDTGEGIPLNKQARLFEAFYQVDGSATRKAGGTGLGLAITKSFVELHGGKIWVESTGIPGAGTTFYVTLPINGPVDEAEQLNDEPPQPPLIMAIDAQRGITLLYERYLIPEGYRFTACHDASQAVQEASTLEPAVILLDYQMPQINGLELTKALRHNNATAEIPIIIYSIKSASVLYEQALAAGASAFLQKPVFRQQLVKAIQKWVYGVK